APTQAASWSKRSFTRASAEPEEVADAGEDGLALRRRGLGARGVAARVELEAALRDDGGDLAGDVGPRAQDRLERLLVEAEAVDVGLRGDGGAARLARHHAHLAEHAAGAERGDVGARAVVLGPDVGLARDDQVQPMRDGALAGQGVALHERRVHEPAREAVALVLRERGEQLDPGQRALPAGELRGFAPAVAG